MLKTTSAGFCVTLIVAIALPSVVLSVMVAVRCVVAVFSSAEAVTCAFPLLLVVPIFTQSALEATLQSVFELTEKDLLSGLAVNVSSAGETESEAFAPACLTVTWMRSLLSLQNTMTPSRASVEVFASAIKKG